MRRIPNEFEMFQDEPLGYFQILNFMYFANNFSFKLLEGCFNVCDMPDHCRQKFMSVNEHKEIRNGTDAFFVWFMELSRNNQLAVIKFIDENYWGVNSHRPGLNSLDLIKERKELESAIISSFNENFGTQVESLLEIEAYEYGDVYYEHISSQEVLDFYDEMADEYNSIREIKELEDYIGDYKLWKSGIDFIPADKTASVEFRGQKFIYKSK